MGQHVDQLLGGHAAGLRGGLPRHVLRQLGTVGDLADPVGHGRAEAQVLVGEGVGPSGVGHEHSAALPVHLDQGGDGRAHAQPPFDAPEVVGVLVGVPAAERGTGLVDRDGAAAIREGEAVEAEPMLQPPHGGVAGAQGDQRVRRGIVEKGIRLVGSQGLHHPLAGLVERGLDVQPLDHQQAFQCGEQTLLQIGSIAVSHHILPGHHTSPVIRGEPRGVGDAILR